MTPEERIKTLEEKVGQLEAFTVTIINVNKKTSERVESLEKAVKEAVKKINDADKVLSEYRDAVANGEAISSSSINEDDVEKIVKKFIMEFDLTQLVKKAEAREENTQLPVIAPPKKQTKKVKIVISVCLVCLVCVGLALFLFSGGMNKKIKMELPIGTILMQNGKIIGKSTSVLNVDVDSEGKFVAMGVEYQINKKSFEELTRKK